MHATLPIIRWPILIAVATLALIVAPVGAENPPASSNAATATVAKEPRVREFAAPMPAASDSPGAGPTPRGALSSPAPDSNAEPVFGIAEPGGSIPRATGPNGSAGWLALRDELAQSGVCWLRTDMTPRFADAMRAFTWLGGPGQCGTTGGPDVKVLAILDDQTMWSAERLCPDVTFSDVRRANRNQFTLSDWTLVVRCIADEFRGRISAYEIWNEPTLPNSAYGYQNGSAEHYAAMLRTAHAEIKLADPNATVIALGGSDLYAGGDGATRLARIHEFSEDLVRLGAADDADAISLHAYSWGFYGQALWESYTAELAFQRDLWARPVWITETGHRASERGTQAEYLVEAYRLFLGAGVDHVFWFALSDQPDGEFGIEGRPAQAALRDFVRAEDTAGADTSDCALDGLTAAER